MKKVVLKVFGCKVNQYEAQVMQERFQKKGFQLINDLSEADFFVVNTCTVTQGSDKELEYLIRKTKRNNPQTKVFLAGCYATHYWDELQENSLVTGTISDKNKYHIPELLEKYIENGERDFSNDLIVTSENDYYGISDFTGRTRAFVKVQDGCNKKCTFCIVTVVRGESRSRKQEAIYEEVSKLVDQGYQEIVLTGVQIGMYSRDFDKKNALPKLINRLSEISGIKRIRLSSIDPLYVDQDLLRCMRENPKFCNHLHISLQSGDDSILKKMKRGHTAEDFLKLITLFKEHIPGFTFSTDMILGFPGETEEAFQNSLDFIQKICPIKVHAFPYSDREGTLAFHYPEKVSERVKKERVRKMIALSNACFQKVATVFVGKEADVLVEQCKELDSGDFVAIGKLSNYIPVQIASKNQLEKDFYSLEIKKIEESALTGVV